MRFSLTPRRLSAAAVAAFVLFSVAGRAAAADAESHVGSGQDQARTLLANAPLLFERNRGQGPADAAFVTRGGGMAAAIAADGFRVKAGAGGPGASVAFEGARADAPLRMAEPAGAVRYIRGERWSGAADRYRRVGFTEVYAGVDVTYYTRDGELEYDFELAAGADPAQIRMRVADGEAQLTATGELALTTDAGRFTLRAPVAYQGAGEIVDARYDLLADGSVGFALGDYDRDQPLVIDPRVGLATYLGGMTSDTVRSVRLDDEGSLWIAGETTSLDFPQPENAFPLELEGGTDIFVTKLERTSATSTDWRIAVTVVVGGSADDRVTDIELGADGSVYLFGDTRSGDFPVSNDAEQSAKSTGRDQFFAVLEESDFPFLSEEGSAPRQDAPPNYDIEYATFIGGTGEDSAQQGFLEELVPGQQCAALAGLSDSLDFPVGVFASQPARAGGVDATFTLICKDPTRGNARRTVYATYFGGSRPESQVAAGGTSDGAYCLMVRTASDDIAVEDDAYQTEYVSSGDFFLTCHTPVRQRFGLPFLYRELGGTYFGSDRDDRMAGMIVERDGEPVGLNPLLRIFTVVTSPAPSMDPPVDEEDEDDEEEEPGPELPAGARETNPGARSVFVAAFDGFLRERKLGFWFGGSTDEEADGIAMMNDCLAIAGRSGSADFPVSESFPQRAAAGGGDVLAAKICFDDELNGVTEYMGLYGGGADERGWAAAMAPDGYEIFAGAAGGTGFPVSAGAPQDSFSGGTEDGFVMELFRPRLAMENVVGAADFRGGALAPGQIFSVFGDRVGPENVLAATLDENGRFPRQLGPTRVLFNTSPAALIAVSPNQVNAIAPFFLEGRTSVQMQIEVEGAPSRVLEMPVVPVAPGVFTVNQSGSGQAAVLNEDYSVNGPSSPARAGSVVQIFLTGAGQTIPAGVDSEVAPTTAPFPRLQASVQVRIAGREAAVLYAGGAPGLTNGLAQINARVPEGLDRDTAAPLQIAVGGISVQPGVTVSIR